MDPRRAYRVVDAFEAELCDYTGAPFAVAVDSCTNALFASLVWARRRWSEVWLPRRTYVGVLQAALNAGFDPDWHDDEWETCGYYWLEPTPIIDSARRIAPQSYIPHSVTCLSFHAAKQLPLGRGGAILTDNEELYEWLCRFRVDGRAPGDTGRYATFPASHIYMPPDTAARGLWILSRWNDAGFTPHPLPPDNYRDLSQENYEHAA